jgi:hypothetical protein
VAALPSLAVEDEPLLSWHDLLDIRHRNNKRAVAKEAAPDEELIGPIEPRTEPEPPRPSQDAHSARRP